MAQIFAVRCEQESPYLAMREPTFSRLQEATGRSVIVRLREDDTLWELSRDLGSARDSDCACGVSIGPLPPVASVPLLYSLELTPACNNHCVGCYNVFLPSKSMQGNARIQRNPLSLQGWQTILDKIGPNAHRLKLSGGEPTLHPNFRAIVRYIQELDIELVLFTNARWPQPNALVEFLSGVPQLVGMLVSLHGARAESHEAFTGVPGSFMETIRNVERAISKGIPVSTSTVLTAANVDEIVEIVALSKSLGAHHAVVNRYLGPLEAELAASKSELVDAVKVIETLRSQGEQIGYGVCLPQCLIANSSTACLAGVTYCTIDPWGNMRPCNHSSLIAGNLLYQSVADAWYSVEMERFRNAVPFQCENCHAIDHCHGGCRAIAMELGTARDPLMGKPLSHSASSPQILYLHPQMRPLARYDERMDRQARILVRGNAAIAVVAETAPILAALDGHTTLSDIQQAFGQPGLSFVGTLYQGGLVELQMPS